MNYDRESTYNAAGAGSANKILSFSADATTEQTRFSHDALAESVVTDPRASREQPEELKPYIGSAEYLG